MLLFVKGKEILAVALVVPLHCVLKLFRRQSVAFYNLVILVSEVEVANNIVDVRIPMYSSLAAGQDKRLSQVLGADMVAHCENEVPIIPDAEGSPVGKEPKLVSHSAPAAGVNQETSQTYFCLGHLAVLGYLLYHFAVFDDQMAQLPRILYQRMRYIVGPFEDIHGVIPVNDHCGHLGHHWVNNLATKNCSCPTSVLLHPHSISYGHYLGLVFFPWDVRDLINTRFGLAYEQAGLEAFHVEKSHMSN
jgi:hypothetical protein